MKNRKINKKKIAALILIICFFASSMILAKYASSMQSNSSSDVAAWYTIINTSGNRSNTLNLTSGETTASYEIKVVSNSEVALTYEVVLTNVPDGLEVKLDNGTYETPTNNTLTLTSNNCAFSANDSVTDHTHTLTFNDPITTSNDGTSTIGIEVIFTQVD